MARTAVLACQENTQSMGGCSDRGSSCLAEGTLWTVDRNVLSRSTADFWRVSFTAAVFPVTDLIHDSRAGMTREGKGNAVEQISRDLRVLVVGGGSEEILEDMSIRSVLLLNNKVRSKL